MFEWPLRSDAAAAAHALFLAAAVFAAIAASATPTTAPAPSTAFAALTVMATLAVAAVEATLTAAVAGFLRTAVLEIASATATTATAPPPLSALLAIAATVAVAGCGSLGLAAEKSLDPAEEAAGLCRSLRSRGGLGGPLRLSILAARLAAFVPTELATPALAAVTTFAAIAEALAA